MTLATGGPADPTLYGSLAARSGWGPIATTPRRHRPTSCPSAPSGWTARRSPTTSFASSSRRPVTSQSPSRRPTRRTIPGALPHMLRPGSLVFTPPGHSVDLRDWWQWWRFEFGANWRRPYGRGRSNSGLDDHPVVHVAYQDAPRYAAWADKELPTEAEWEYAARGGLDGAEFAWGDELTPRGRHMANTWQGAFPQRKPCRRWLYAHLAGRGVPAQRLRPARHDRQRVGVDRGLVLDAARGRRNEGLLYPGEPKRRPAGRQL